MFLNVGIALPLLSFSAYQRQQPSRTNSHQLPPTQTSQPPLDYYLLGSVHHPQRSAHHRNSRGKSSLLPQKQLRLETTRKKTTSWKGSRFQKRYLQRKEECRTWLFELECSRMIKQVDFSKYLYTMDAWYADGYQYRYIESYVHVYTCYIYIYIDTCPKALNTQKQRKKSCFWSFHWNPRLRVHSCRIFCCNQSSAS